MENFLLDNEDILFHLEHMDIDRIIALKEDNFKEAETYSYAPVNAEDARDSYHKVLRHWNPLRPILMRKVSDWLTEKFSMLRVPGRFWISLRKPI